jgi:hypothetical protein
MKHLSAQQIAVLRLQHKASVTASLIESATVLAEEASKNKVKYKGHTLDLEELPRDQDTGAYTYDVKIDGQHVPGLVDGSPELAMEKAERHIDSKKVKAADDVDFDEESVVNAMMKALGAPEDQKEDIAASVKEGQYQSWTNCYSITIDGTEYTVLSGEDAADQLAKDLVKQDLEQEPENFNPNFIRQHLYVTDTDRRLIAQEDADSYVDDLDEDRVIEEADMKDEYEAAEDDEKAKETILYNAREKLREEISERVEEGLKDPIEYLVNEQGIYTVEELMKQHFIHIDVDEAAEDAVTTDGWAHFVSRYDGDYSTTPEGFVYFRET